MPLSIDAAGQGLCRIEVHAPGRRFSLAVPVDVSIADLMPAVIEFAGEDLDEEGVEDGGWVLQRLAGEAFDEADTLSTAGVHDGETLYLRTAHEAMPPVHYDDLLDAVGGMLRDRGDGWRPEHSRRWLLCLAGAITVVAFALVSTAAPTAPRAPVAAVAAVLLLVAGVAAARVGGDRATGTLLAIAGTALTALGAYLAVEGLPGSPRPVAAMVASAVVFVCALVVWAVIRAPWLLGLAWGSWSCLPGTGAVVAGADWAGGAAVAAVLVLFSGLAVPRLSFRMAGMRLPLLPSTSEELQQGIDPVPAETAIQGTSSADAFMTSLFGWGGLVMAGCLTVLAVSHRPSDSWFMAALSCVLLLHTRAVGSLWHRLALLAPGSYGLCLAAYGLAGRLGEGGERAGAALVLVIVALVVTEIGLEVPGRRMLPHWGRAADVLHALASAAVLPLLLWVLGVYGYLRGLGG